MTAVYDLVVLGAGMAGLTAARALAKARKSVLVLEAASRVGGRIWTVPGIIGALPSELGAEFVHGQPEPTLALAREAGVELLPLPDRHVTKHGSQFRELPNPWQALAALLDPGKPQEEDTSAAEFLTKKGVDPGLQERVRQLVEGFEAAPLAEVSIQSLATDAESLSTDNSQFRLRGGYGRLVEFCLNQLLEARVEVRLQSRVTNVKWQLRGPVELSVAGAATPLRARTCVVTAPVAVLRDTETLRFEPAVRAWSGPLAQLGMGHAARVMLQFRRDFAEHAAPRDAFIHQPSAVRDVLGGSEQELRAMDCLGRRPQGPGARSGIERAAQALGPG